MRFSPLFSSFVLYFSGFRILLTALSPLHLSIIAIKSPCLFYFCYGFIYFYFLLFIRLIIKVFNKMFPEIPQIFSRDREIPGRTGCFSTKPSPFVTWLPNPRIFSQTKSFSKNGTRVIFYFPKRFLGYQKLFT